MDISQLLTTDLLMIVVAFGLGGVLKGATGVGAPFFAVPIMAVQFDVPFAVAVFLTSNVVSNVAQVHRFRANDPDRQMTRRFAIAAVFGAVLGTLALAGFSSRVLTTTVALVVLAYVAFRLFNPHWSLSLPAATRLATPVGAIGGILQGATGLSGPVAITFVNAIGFQRPQFIYTMSLYFLLMALAQFPIQIALGIMTLDRFILGALALIPLFAGMSLGEVIGRRISRTLFDRVIMTLLSLLALRLLADNFL